MRNMFLTIFFIGLGLVSYAQRTDSTKKDRSQKIKAIYVAYMSQELNLTEDEAQKFWPICNEYEKELKATHKGNMDELSKEEALLGIRKKYQDKFVKILGKDRANSFYRKDAEFKRRLIDRVKEMRGKQGRGGKQNGMGRGNKNKGF